MLEEFARLYKLRYKKEFPWRERKIKSVAILFFQNISHTLPSCKAHVINLGTQVFIGTYSKSPHYSPHDPKAHEPDTSIHSLTPQQERSSAKQKELYKSVQVKATVSPMTQLLLDMKV